MMSYLTTFPILFRQFVLFSVYLYYSIYTCTIAHAHRDTKQNRLNILPLDSKAVLVPYREDQKELLSVYTCKERAGM